MQDGDNKTTVYHSYQSSKYKILSVFVRCAYILRDFYTKVYQYHKNTI